MDSYILIPNFNKIKIDLQVSDSYLGVLSGSYLFLNGISAVLWALASDVSTLKRKVFLSTSLLSGGVFSLLAYTSSNPFYFFIYRILTAASLGAVFPLGFSIIADTFRSDRRTSMYMLWYTLGGFGLALGYSISLFAGSYYSWRLALYIGAVVLFAGALISLTLLEPVKGGSEEEIEFLLKKFGYYPYKFEPRDLKLILSNKTNIFITVQGVFGTIPNGVIFTWAVHYIIREVGASEMAASLLLGFMSTGALGGLLVAYLADISYRKKPENRAKIAAFSSIIESILFVIFFAVPMKLNIYSNDMLEALNLIKALLFSSIGFAFWFSIFFIAMFFNSSVGPIKDSILSDANLPEHRATVFAGESIIELFSKAISISIVGVMSDLFGGLRVPIIATMFFWILSGLSWFKVARTYPYDIKKVDELLVNRSKYLVVKHPESLQDEEKEQKRPKS